MAIKKLDHISKLMNRSARTVPGGLSQRSRVHQNVTENEPVYAKPILKPVEYLKIGDIIIL
jgi:hypothetical protein